MDTHTVGSGRDSAGCWQTHPVAAEDALDPVELGRLADIDVGQAVALAQLLPQTAYLRVVREPARGAGEGIGDLLRRAVLQVGCDANAPLDLHGAAKAAAVVPQRPHLHG